MFSDFKPLFPHLKPLRFKFVWGVLAGVLYGVASGAGLPFLSKSALPIIFNDQEKLADVPDWFLDGFHFLFGDDPHRLLVASCIFIPFILLLRGLGGYLSAFWMSEVGLRGIESFRKEVFSRLLSLPMAFFEKRASGDLLARVVGDTGVLQKTITSVAGDIVKQPVMLVAALVYLVTEAMQNEGVFFALIGGVTVPLLVFPVRFLGKRLKKRSKRLQGNQGELNGVASEVIQNPLEVRAYNLEGRLNEQFGGLVEEGRKVGLKMVRYRRSLGPMVEVVAAIGFAFALYLGAKNEMTLEDFLGVAMALFLAYEPVKKLGAIHGYLEEAKASMTRVEDILKAEDSLPELEHPEALPNDGGEVLFKGVHFSYGSEEILRGVNVEIASGETVALVGESGGGKTTFANLIPRFYDVSKGEIRVNGKDVRTVAKKDLRNLIAVVPQMPVLFRGTIRENILMGKPDASEEEMEAAARRAFAHDFIVRQEKGYDTEVSEKGSSLSGGQRQRIAIARAFIKNAPILILDEATSALDAESEEKVQQAITELVKGRTTLMITHRESTEQFADRVLLFDKGVVREGRG